VNTNNATNLEAIIRRHAQAPAAPATKLLPFSKEDWYDYAGCETKSPQIARTTWGDIVLDGESVGYHRHMQDDLVSFQACFFSKAVARLVAEHLASLDNPSEIEIAKYIKKAGG